MVRWGGYSNMWRAAACGILCRAGVVVVGCGWGQQTVEGCVVWRFGERQVAWQSVAGVSAGAERVMGRQGRL